MVSITVLDLQNLGMSKPSLLIDALYESLPQEFRLLLKMDALVESCRHEVFVTGDHRSPHGKGLVLSAQQSHVSPR